MSDRFLSMQVFVEIDGGTLLDEADNITIKRALPSGGLDLKTIAAQRLRELADRVERIPERRPPEFEHKP